MWQPLPLFLRLMWGQHCPPEHGKGKAGSILDLETPSWRPRWLSNLLQRLPGWGLSPHRGPMGRVQAHQAGTFRPKSPGYLLILGLRGWCLLFEAIKVLSRNALQLLCHSQVGAGLRCQLGALDQQPEDGPCTHHRALSAHPAHQHPAPPSGSPEARSCPGSHSAHLQALSCAPLHPRKLLPYPGKWSPDSSRSAPSPHPPPFLKITSSS